MYGWDASASFSILAPCLDMDDYRYHAVLGFISSVGGTILLLDSVSSPFLPFLLLFAHFLATLSAPLFIITSRVLASAPPRYEQYRYRGDLITGMRENMADSSTKHFVKHVQKPLEHSQNFSTSLFIFLFAFYFLFLHSFSS
jgi:hypothetical protein